MEEQIKMAKLNAEYSKKRNDISSRMQKLEALKHIRLQNVDDDYHDKKRGLLVEIANLRKQKEGLALDSPKRADITDDIRIIEDKLQLLHDERDIEARRVVGDTFAERLELEEESRRVSEWLESEKIKVMEEQLAKKQSATEDTIEDKQ